MTKLKKQVAKLKINQFLEQNKVILFYQSSLLNSSNRLNPFSKASGSFLYTINEGMDCCKISTLFVKNKIAQKAFYSYSENLTNLKCVNKKRTSMDKKGDTELDTLARIDRIDMAVSRTLITKRVLPFPKSILFLRKRKRTREKEVDNSTPTCIPLFQGNSILLGCTRLSLLHEILKRYNTPIGGLYGTCILDLSQVKRLAEYSQNDSSHQKVITCIKKPAVNLLFLIKNRLSIFFLSIRQTQLLQLLQVRNKQLSSL